MNITIGVGYFPMWRRGGLCFHENGGRRQGECLDMTVNVWKFSFTLTVWGLPVHIKIPLQKNGRGFCVGWFPLGAK